MIRHGTQLLFIDKHIVKHNKIHQLLVHSYVFIPERCHLNTMKINVKDNTDHGEGQNNSHLIQHRDIVSRQISSQKSQLHK